ncbi:hypothetical protein EXN66_Car016427 [Channa argus]|uniref:Uncharacterized protein n=1 Tax=Channa argus TaxID=215402 RepID=A0A6G1QEB1_CHAAH|nr:hypothetical protein EXN66_Car016427 [Channa argus]
MRRHWGKGGQQEAEKKRKRRKLPQSLKETKPEENAQNDKVEFSEPAHAAAAAVVEEERGRAVKTVDTEQTNIKCGHVEQKEAASVCCQLQCEHSPTLCGSTSSTLSCGDA